MGIRDMIRGAIMRLLNFKEIKTLGCNMTSYMEAAIREWDDLFYLVNQPLHSIKMAQAITGYLATLATNEITLDAGAGARGQYIKDQATHNLLPCLWEAVQLAGVGGMSVIKPYVRAKSVYVQVIPRSRIYPSKFGPNRRIEAGFFTDYEMMKSGKTAVRIEQFDLTNEGLHITNKAYKLRDLNMIGDEISLESIDRWADLEPELTISGVDRPHFGIIRMPNINVVDGSDYPVSIYANAVDSIKEIDKTYAQFLWERDTGKRRMMLDRTVAMKDPISGKSAIPFRDLASDYLMTIDMPDEKPWADYTPEMRVDAYQKAIDMQLRIMEVQIGFSPGTFQADIKAGKVTATQIINEDRTTYNTVKAVQDRGMTSGLMDALYWVDAYTSIYGLAPTGNFEPSVTFGDSIFEDTGVEFQRRKALADGKYLRPELLNSWYFGVSKEEAAAMIPEQETPDNIMFGGGRNA